jgi:hypothetical protein
MDTETFQLGFFFVFDYRVQLASIQLIVINWHKDYQLWWEVCKRKNSFVLTTVYYFFLLICANDVLVFGLGSAGRNRILWTAHSLQVLCDAVVVSKY